MPNKNYESGRRYEYALAKELRAARWDVIRASGSHGKFDLIAVSQDKPHTVMLIQCKVTASETVAKKLCADFRRKPPYNGATHFVQVMSVKLPGGVRREAYI